MVFVLQAESAKYFAVKSVHIAMSSSPVAEL